MSDADPAVVNLNPVACESCRTKKCKCDRKIPVCSQCAKPDLLCIYPQSSRRGFPEGYLSGLERRLLETEYALFEALSGSLMTENSRTLYRMVGEKQSKTAKSQEWERLPIATQTDVHRWLGEKRSIFNLNSVEYEAGIPDHVTPILDASGNVAESSLSPYADSPLSATHTREMVYTPNVTISTLPTLQEYRSTRPDLNLNQQAAPSAVEESSLASQLSTTHAWRFF